jgi:hypothetical protein
VERTRTVTTLMLLGLFSNWSMRLTNCRLARLTVKGIDGGPRLWNISEYFFVLRFSEESEWVLIASHHLAWCDGAMAQKSAVQTRRLYAKRP